MYWSDRFCGILYVRNSVALLINSCIGLDHIALHRAHLQVGIPGSAKTQLCPLAALYIIYAVITREMARDFGKGLSVLIFVMKSTAHPG